MAWIRTPIYYNLPRSTPTRAVGAGDEAEADQPQQEVARDPERDGYVEKLIKYIPGEVVAAFAGAALLAGRVPEWNPSIAVKVLFVCFLIATPIYFWSQSRSRPVEDRPVGFFYVLSMVAFFCWALGVSDQARQSIGTSAQLAEFLLAFGAFFVPAFDTWLTALVVPTTKTS